MRRLVYAPEVFAYIKTDKEVLNISNDIIGGSVTRRINAVSSASLKLQNRSKFYNGRLKPMDRIIIYLKKTQPILVFSGYLDSVPFLQPTPRPITINASCTLKRLEFTYFDPALPNVQDALARYVGAGPDNGALPDYGQGFRFFDTRNNGNPEEVGFGRMLLWLINEVGSWPTDKIHILPIPPKWIDTAANLFISIQKEEQATADTVSAVMKSLFTSTGTGIGGTQTVQGNSPVISLSGDQAAIASAIDNVIQKRAPDSPYIGLGSAFVDSGIKNGVEPRFLAAIAGAESTFGTAGSGVSKHNGFGYGPGLELGSWAGGIETVAEHLKKDYIDQGLATVVTIRNKWAPAGAANDPNGLNSNWVDNVKTIMTEMGGDPDQSVAIDTTTTTSTISRARASTSSTTVKFSPTALVRRSATGSWRGTQGPIEYLYTLVQQLGAGYAVKRRKESTGNADDRTTCNYDHDTSVNNAFAMDITFANQASGDRAATLLYSALKEVAQKVEGDQGDASTWGKRGGNVLFTTPDNIFRYQLIYRCGGTPCGGDHMNLIHLSCRSMLPSSNNTIGPVIAGFKSIQVAGGDNTTSGTSLTSSSGSGVSTSSASGGKFSVYIEAGHSSPRMPGYQGQTGAGDEAAKVLQIKAAVEEKLRASSDIIVMPTNGSTPTNCNADIYVSIHMNTDFGEGVVGPSSLSVSGSGLGASGEGRPNYYSTSDGGTGAPSTETLPRKNINLNSDLINNSHQLASALSTSLGMPEAGSNRMNNYYGFYYSNAKACAIIEFKLDAAPSNAAQQIATGIGNYINANPGAGGGTGASTASKVIDACIRTAKFNNNGAGHGPIGYSSPGKRNVPLIEAQNAKAAMDCSGFISNAMIEAGAPSSTSENTATFVTKGTAVDRASMAPGTLLIHASDPPIAGSTEHVVMYIGDNKIVQCSGGNAGPNIADLSGFPESEYKAYVNDFIGTTDTPGSTADTGTGSGQTAFDTSQVLNTVFNFPGNTLESLILQGSRALENDTKLLGVVADIAEASQRSFASHPNGDFMAWFPDYFNVSGRNPYLLISENELIDCTIELSDRNLATHVFMNGDVSGVTSLGGSVNPILERAINGQYGVVNIEQAFLLDTFLVSTEAAAKKLANPNKNRSILGEDNATAFLTRYGARPFVVNNPALRHPYMNFFMAYQTFQKKWAEQFESVVEFTFMPELFPGTTVKIQGLNVNFYCDEVTHNFDYSGGFTTTANLMAPSTEAGYNFGLSLSKPPFKNDVEGLGVVGAAVKKVTTPTTTNRSKTTKRGG